MLNGVTGELVALGVGHPGLVAERHRLADHGLGDDERRVALHLLDRLAGALARIERIVERDEIERRPDPADAHRQMSPAQQQIRPFAEEDVHCDSLARGPTK
jgi:hypothetical protein